MAERMDLPVSVRNSKAYTVPPGEDFRHSNLSSVYDSAAGTLRLAVREDFDIVYEFGVDQ